MAHKSETVKIVHITTVPLSLIFLRHQVGYMRQLGFEVHAISSPDPLLQQFGERENVDVHPLGMRRRITPIHDLGAVVQLGKMLREIKPVVVHAHTPKGGLLGMIASWLTRMPVRIYSMLGLPYMTASGRSRMLLRWTEKISCRLAHEVICVGPSLRQVAITDGICPPEKIRVLRGGSANGIDALGQFNPNEEAKISGQAIRDQCGIDDNDLVLGFVGRIVGDKGVIELISSWQEIKDIYKDTHLIIVGPFEERDAIPHKANLIMRNDPRIHVVGSVDDTAPYYAAMDVVILPTYREGLPNVPLEAASMGTPVVATNIPGCVDAVEDGVTGTLVPPRDVRALQNAIEMYLNNPDLRKAHGEAGRERVLREFRQEDIWEAIYQEYVSLLTERGIQVPAPATST